LTQAQAKAADVPYLQARLVGCCGVVIGSLFSCTPAAPGTGTIHSTITDNIVRVGLNYQFH
jgi:hypothetical protein